jgi:hypothetical protein
MGVVRPECHAQHNPLPEREGGAILEGDSVVGLDRGVIQLAMGFFATLGLGGGRLGLRLRGRRGGFAGRF